MPWETKKFMWQLLQYLLPISDLEQTYSIQGMPVLVHKKVVKIMYRILSIKKL